jgi:uncharacterized membrane protein YhaH (DUF805 family)
MSSNAQQELRVRLVFHGQILDGFDAEQVKRSIGEMFRLEGVRLARLFSGERTVIKPSLSPEEAARYVTRFEMAGARLQLEQLDAPDVAPPAPAPTPTAASAPVRAPAPAPAAARPAPGSPPVAQPLALASVEPHREASPSKRIDSAFAPTPEVVVVHEAPPILGFGLSGRLARRPYAAGASVGWLAMGWAARTLLTHPHGATMLLLGLGTLVCALWTWRLTILRLHDLGLAGWWVLIGLVPYVGTVASLILSLVPGSNNENKYGEVPDPGSQALRLVVLAVVVVVGTVLRHGGLASLERPVAQLESVKEVTAAAPTDEELTPLLKPAAARRVFIDAYWPAAAHKAFAISDGGTWGWNANAGTAQAAQEQALAQCEQNRQPYTGECKLLSVDGEWAE